MYNVCFGKNNIIRLQKLHFDFLNNVALFQIPLVVLETFMFCMIAFFIVGVEGGLLGLIMFSTPAIASAIVSTAYGTPTILVLNLNTCNPRIVPSLAKNLNCQTWGSSLDPQEWLLLACCGWAEVALDRYGSGAHYRILQTEAALVQDRSLQRHSII